LPDFFRSEVAPVAGLQPAVLERADGDAPELVDRVPDGFEHPADLAIASLADGDAQRRMPGVFSIRRHQLDFGRLRAAAVDRHPARQALDVVAVREPEHLDFVDACDAVAGMSELCRQIAVVGQQQQPLGFEVEAADRVDIFPDAAEQVDHRRAPLGI